MAGVVLWLAVPLPPSTQPGAVGAAPPLLGRALPSLSAPTTQCHDLPVLKSAKQPTSLHLQRPFLAGPRVAFDGKAEGQEPWGTYLGFCPAPSTHTLTAEQPNSRASRGLSAAEGASAPRQYVPAEFCDIYHLVFTPRGLRYAYL